MTTNPFYNAILALGYVFLVVNLISFGAELGASEPEDNILMPIGMLSLLVLSVSVMAYLFFYHPIIMIVNGKQKEAALLFGRTVAIFAGLTLCVLVGSFLFFK